MERSSKATQSWALAHGNKTERGVNRGATWQNPHATKRWEGQTVLSYQHGGGTRCKTRFATSQTATRNGTCHGRTVSKPSKWANQERAHVLEVKKGGKNNNRKKSGRPMRFRLQRWGIKPKALPEEQQTATKRVHRRKGTCFDRLRAKSTMGKVHSNGKNRGRVKCTEWKTRNTR